MACASQEGHQADDGALPFSDAESAEATCVAAADAEACRAIRFDLGSDDGWAECAWVEFHEATFTEDACTYGAALGECHFASGGEEDRSTLLSVCGPPYEDWNSIYAVERNGRSYVSFAANYLPALQADVCGFTNGHASSGPDICDCPCLPEFPGTVCLEGGGYEECPAVPRHRVQALACEDTTGPCVTDADCGSGEACVCKVGPVYETSCVPATCATDADCGLGEVCAISWDKPPNGPSEVGALACRRAFDDCDGELCGCPEDCQVDLSTGAWSCTEDAC